MNFNVNQAASRRLKKNGGKNQADRNEKNAKSAGDLSGSGYKVNLTQRPKNPSLASFPILKKKDKSKR